jgi:CheY-like chemotaxis protein
MSRLLVIDDQLSDLNIATGVARSVGIEDIRAMTTVCAAIRFLGSALCGGVPMPSVIVLDLDLGYESGHELLRFWHRHLRSAGVAMIIWTVLDEDQCNICKLFGVHAVVLKWEGADVLKAALRACCGQDAPVADRPRFDTE